MSDSSSSRNSYLPTCWDNNDRMSAMFAPLRSKNVNPDDWNSKINFWSNAIKEWIRSRGSAIFTKLEVERAFKRKGIIPASLGTVLQEMERDRSIMLSSSVQRQLSSGDGWVSWTWNEVLYNPLQFALGYTMGALGYGTPANDNCSYTCLQSLEENAMQLLSMCKSELRSTNNVVLLKELITLWKSVHTEVTDNEVRLMILLLHKRKMAALVVYQGREIVKLPEEDGERVDVVSVDPQVDCSSVVLKQSVTKLNREIDELQNKWDEETKHIKTYLKDGNRRRAQHHLRERKFIEKRQEKATGQLENVQKLLETMESSASDNKVVEALKAGVEALKANSPKIDELEDTIADIQEVFEDQKDLEDMISKPLHFSSTSVSDTELEDELAELLNEDMNSKKTPVSSDVIDLPSPPTESPKQSDINNLRARLAEL